MAVSENDFQELAIVMDFGLSSDPVRVNDTKPFWKRSVVDAPMSPESSTMKLPVAGSSESHSSA